MTTELIGLLCDLLCAGPLVTTPKKVAGGMQNQMLHVKTEKAEYAVKILNADYMAKDGSITKYEKSEAIARNLSDAGISTITAIMHGNSSVIKLDNQYFMVFPWSKAKSLERYAVSLPHAIKIARLIGHIHKLDMNAAGMNAPTWEFYTNSEIQIITEKISTKQLPFVSKMESQLEDILKWNSKYEVAMLILSENLVLSHSDLDQTNILWDEEENPLVIDWEFVGLLNPTQEVVNQALNWSGISSYKINYDIFKEMLMEYRKSSGRGFDDIEASFWGIMGDWINWLVENLELSLEKDITKKEEFQLSIEEKIEYALKILPYLAGAMDKLVQITGEVNL